MTPDAAFPVLATLLGLILGSFYNVCIARYESGLSILRPRSHCPLCGRMLGPLELVPVLSWLWQRGRCKGCAERISLKYPLVELLSGLWALLLAIQFGPGWEWLGHMVLGGMLLVASGIDLDNFILPDRLTLSGFPLALGFAALRPDLALSDAAWGAVAGAGAFKLIQVGYKFLRGVDGLGTGDVKLMLLIGAWLGWQLVPMAVLVGSVAALPVGILYALRSKRTGQPAIVPYGPFLSLGAMACVLYGGELLTLLTP
ncbi:MAG: A24 family peptidase [Desulfocurvibacter africanus]